MCHSFIMIPSPDYGLAAFIRATGLVLRVFACSELRYPQAQQYGQRPPRRAKNIVNNSFTNIYNEHKHDAQLKYIEIENNNKNIEAEHIEKNMLLL